jgi:hypothetical protein
MLSEYTQEFFTSYRTPQGIVKNLPVKKIYPTHPHGTADNHFSGDHVLDFAGQKGSGENGVYRGDDIAIFCLDCNSNNDTRALQAVI